VRRRRMGVGRRRRSERKSGVERRSRKGKRRMTMWTWVGERWWRERLQVWWWALL
jgi:hypothetical protein